MTIICTLLSQHGAVAASDSLALFLTQEGAKVTKISTDPMCDKTFAVGDWLIGASANLLFLGGKKIGQYINDLFLGRKPMPTDQCMKMFADALHGFFTNERMLHQSRKVTAFLVSRIGPPEIWSIDIYPQAGDSTSTQITVNVDRWPHWYVGGDDEARTMVTKRISDLGSTLLTYKTQDLSAVARDLVIEGIAASGYLPEDPSQKKCGGIPMIKTLRFKRQP
jgi:hypothetical protein